MDYVFTTFWCFLPYSLHMLITDWELEPGRNLTPNFPSNFPFIFFPPVSLVDTDPMKFWNGTWSRGSVEMKERRGPQGTTYRGQGPGSRGAGRCPAPRSPGGTSGSVRGPGDRSAVPQRPAARGPLLQVPPRRRGPRGSPRPPCPCHTHPPALLKHSRVPSVPWLRVLLCSSRHSESQKEKRTFLEWFHEFELHNTENISIKRFHGTRTTQHGNYFNIN